MGEKRGIRERSERDEWETGEGRLRDRRESSVK